MNTEKILPENAGHAEFSRDILAHNRKLEAINADLLAALEEIAANAEADVLASSRKNGHHESYTLAGIARAAIAKAKG